MTPSSPQTFKRSSAVVIVIVAFLVAALSLFISAVLYYFQLTSEITSFHEFLLNILWGLIVTSCLTAMICVSLRPPSFKQILVIFFFCQVAQVIGYYGYLLTGPLVILVGNVLSQFFNTVHFDPIRLILSPLNGFLYWLPISLGIYFAYRPRMPFKVIPLICLTSLMQLQWWTLNYDGGDVTEVVVLSSSYAIPQTMLQYMVIGFLLRHYAPVILNLQHIEPDSLMETET